MAPRHPRLGAGLGDDAGQDGVAHQALALVEFAGVHVGFAGVAGGADEKFGAVAAQGGGEQGRIAVVELSAAQVADFLSVLGDTLFKLRRLTALAG